MEEIKFNFIIDCSNSELEFYTKSSEINPSVYTRGDTNWCLQTFKILSKISPLALSCSNKIKNDCINIIHSEHLLKLKGSASDFIVCVQADFPRRAWAHYHIVQNKNQAAKDSSYILHW